MLSGCFSFGLNNGLNKFLMCAFGVPEIYHLALCCVLWASNDSRLKPVASKMNNFEERKSGEIYSFANLQPDAKRPFAVIKRINDENYLGCMITHGDPRKWSDNIPMEPDYFEEEYCLGEKSTVVYSNKNGRGSCFVKVALMKAVDLNVIKSGQLTQKGLSKLYEAVKVLNPKKW